ncbi:MAG: HNH endonuclease [Bifidobacteriaceae bacterium]|jgi:hypothetical protein|nr:HNH endonuclease [Bifidobacteriaceae bacterium]
MTATPLTEAAPAAPAGAARPWWDGLGAAELSELAAEMDLPELLDLAEALGPGGLAGLVLAEADLAEGVDGRDLVRLTALYDRQAKWCEGRAALALAQACDRAEDERSHDRSAQPGWALIDEAALVCGRTRHWAGRLARVGAAALERPPLAAGLGAGLMDSACADTVLRAANRLTDPEDQARVVAHGLGLASIPANHPQVRDGCERLAAKLEPGGLSRAHEAAYRERSVSYRPRAASMGVLSVYGAAHELASVRAAIEEAARAHAGRGSDPSDERTAGARQYDAFIAWFKPRPAGGAVGAGRASAPAPGKVARSRFEVLVRMDATTLLCLDDRPGLILGAGPIPAEVGRAIAQDATWRALFTDPASGRPVWASPKAFQAGLTLGPVAPQRGSGRQTAPVYPLTSPDSGGAGPPGGLGDELDSLAGTINPWGADPAGWPMEQASADSYLPGPGLRRMLAIRQARCANPACRQPHYRCEVDHIQPYDPTLPAEDQTVLLNLQHLSKGCHDLKTRHGWTCRRDPATGETIIETPDGFAVRIAPDRLD